VLTARLFAQMAFQNIVTISTAGRERILELAWRID
jgi:hypothetical protein